MSLQIIPRISGVNLLPKADYSLEQKENNSVGHVFEEFKKKGGSLQRLGHDYIPFQLKPGDIVFTSCSSGRNRSQTLRAFLVAHNCNVNLQPPHAVRAGRDPYNGRIKKWRAPCKDKLHLKQDGFTTWSGGCAKINNFGHEHFQKWWDAKDAPETLVKMRDYYTKFFYKTEFSSEARRVYITFQENAHVHLQRLSEANDTLDNVVVLYFAFPEDPLTCSKSKLWKETTRKVEAYIGLADILQTSLDLSAVSTIGI